MENLTHISQGPDRIKHWLKLHGKIVRQHRIFNWYFDTFFNIKKCFSHSDIHFHIIYLAYNQIDNGNNCSWDVSIFLYTLEKRRCKVRIKIFKYEKNSQEVSLIVNSKSKKIIFLNLFLSAVFLWFVMRKTRFREWLLFCLWSIAFRSILKWCSLDFSFSYFKLWIKNIGCVCGICVFVKTKLWNIPWNFYKMRQMTLRFEIFYFT